MSSDEDSDSDIEDIEFSEEYVSSSDSDDNTNSQAHHQRVGMRWTEDEIKTLKTMKQRGKSNEVIARRLHRTLGSVEMKWKSER